VSKKAITSVIIIILTLIGLSGGVYLVKRNQELRKRAEAATTIYFQPDTVETRVGETINLDIFVDTGENLLGVVLLDIDYDPQVLKPLSLTFSPLFPVIVREIDLSQPGKISGSGAIKIEGNNTRNNLVTGTRKKVASLSFKTLSSATLGTNINFTDQTLAYSTTEEEGVNAIIRKVPATIIITSATENNTTSQPLSSNSSSIATNDELTNSNTPPASNSQTATNSFPETETTETIETPMNIGMGEANISPSPIPSSTSTPTLTPKPTSAFTPLKTPTPSQPIPASGNIFSTSFLFAIGSLLLISFFLFA